jgi:hypothetical protein
LAIFINQLEKQWLQHFFSFFIYQFILWLSYTGPTLPVNSLRGFRLRHCDYSTVWENFSQGSFHMLIILSLYKLVLQVPVVNNQKPDRHSHTPTIAVVNRKQDRKASMTA